MIFYVASLIPFLFPPPFLGLSFHFIPPLLSLPAPSPCFSSFPFFFLDWKANGVGAFPISPLSFPLAKSTPF